MLAAGLATLAVALAPAFAAGHPAVDEGLARLRAADFAGALEAFDEADATAELPAPETARLLEGRAMAALALGDHDVLDASLARLAALDPGHAFSPEAPPAITLGFARARATLAEVQVPAEPVAPVAEPVAPSPPASVSLRATEPALLGAHEATPARPALALVHASRAAPPPWAPRPRRPSDHPGGRSRHVPWGWIGAGVGATVLTAAAVVTAIVLGGSGGGGGGAGGDAGEGDE